METLRPQRFELKTMRRANAMRFPQVVQGNLFPNKAGLSCSAAP